MNEDGVAQESSGLIEQLRSLLEGPYGNYFLAGLAGGVVLLLLMFWVVKRFRQGRERWEEARGSARGMRLEMQENLTSGADESR